MVAFLVKWYRVVLVGAVLRCVGDQLGPVPVWGSQRTAAALVANILPPKEQQQTVTVIALNAHGSWGRSISVK